MTKKEEPSTFVIGVDMGEDQAAIDPPRQILWNDSMYRPVEAVMKRIADVASNVGFQAGVPAIEVAGQIVSVLAVYPEHCERFMAEGSELFFDHTFAPENGSLSYRAGNGKIMTPAELRAKLGTQQ